MQWEANRLDQDCVKVLEYGDRKCNFKVFNSCGNLSITFLGVGRVCVVT